MQIQREFLNAPTYTSGPDAKQLWRILIITFQLLKTDQHIAWNCTKRSKYNLILDIKHKPSYNRAPKINCNTTCGADEISQLKLQLTHNWKKHYFHFDKDDQGFFYSYNFWSAVSCPSWVGSVPLICGME